MIRLLIFEYVLIFSAFSKLFTSVLILNMVNQIYNQYITKFNHYKFVVFKKCRK